MRTDIVDVIRGRPDDQNSEPPAGHVLLVWDVLVDRDERVELIFGSGEKLAVLLATEACVSHRLALVAFGSEQEFNFPGDTLVEQQLHFKAEDRLALASSIATTHVPFPWRVSFVLRRPSRRFSLNYDHTALL